MRTLARGMMNRPRKSRNRRNCGLPVASVMTAWNAKSSATAGSPRSIAASIAARALWIVRRWVLVARSAANPAASVSTAVRSSMMCSASVSDAACPGSIRNSARAGCSATNDPMPWRVATSPSARKAATASRITVRLTPVASIISCSVGSRVPGSNRPAAMSDAMR